jgi:segregation and condensation protein B
MDHTKLTKIIEGMLLAAQRSLDINQIESIFDNEKFPLEELNTASANLSLQAEKPSKKDIYSAIQSIKLNCENHSFELKETASGYRLQIRDELSFWISRLWEEKPKKYSRAFLETLSLIAYKQPVTRGEIEEIRGVSVSSDTIRALMERDWIKIVGNKDVPGRPALYATTKNFLSYFNLKDLKELPVLQDIKDIAQIKPELVLGNIFEVNEIKPNESNPNN